MRPRFGVLGRLMGGVGGTSPVIRTRPSIVPQRSFKAAMALRVKTSRFSRLGMASESAWDIPPLGVMPGSLEGHGGRGSWGAEDAESDPELFSSGVCML